MYKVSENIHPLDNTILLAIQVRPPRDNPEPEHLDFIYAHPLKGLNKKFLKNGLDQSCFDLFLKYILVSERATSDFGIDC